MIGLKIAEGREAEVFAWQGGAAVLKLYRPGYSGHFAESAALEQLENRGVAPRLIDVVQIDGRHGLVMERLAGSDMLILLERQPWRLLELARSFADAHVLVHSVQAPDLLDVRQLLGTRIESAVERPELRDFALRTLDGLPSGDRLCHGDLHPGNILVDANRVSVIDWTNTTRGVPEADFARTMLLLERGDPMPGTSLVFRAVMAAGRSAFARAYSRAYRKRAPNPLVQIDLWSVVHTAARFAEGIAEEEPKLLAFLDRAWRASGQRTIE